MQVLSGSGFSTMPSGLTQGTWSTSTLQAAARTWGGQLAQAGVNTNLAPVMDTVPAGFDNPPIGGFDREYGHTPSVVGSHGTAFAAGMAAAGVFATIKHFPGLGRVSANPDTTAHVTDTVTTADRPVSRTVPGRDARGGADRHDVDGVLPPHRPEPPGRVLADDRDRSAAQPTRLPRPRDQRRPRQRGAGRRLVARRPRHRLHQRRRRHRPHRQPGPDPADGVPRSQPARRATRASARRSTRRQCTCSCSSRRAA